MITYKTVSTMLSATSNQHLINEIEESRRWGYGFISVKLIPSDAGWKYRSSYSALQCEGYVKLDEWYCQL
jgi:hypothetical protein